METVKPTRNILVAVDVQRDFIDGSLAVREGEQVVAPLNTIAETVRQLAFTISSTCSLVTLLSTKAWARLTGTLAGRVRATQARRWRPLSRHEHLTRRFRYFSADWQLTFA